MKISFQISGIDRLDRKFASLPRKVGGTIVRTAVRNAQKIALSACQAAARALPHSEKKLFAVGQDDIRMAELMARNMVIAAPRRQVRGSYSLHVQFKRGIAQLFHYARGARTLVNFRYRNPRHPEEPEHLRIGRTIGVTFIPTAIEYGHGAGKEKAARPFMRKGAAASQRPVMTKLEKDLGRAIEEAAKEV